MLLGGQALPERRVEPRGTVPEPLAEPWHQPDQPGVPGLEDLCRGGPGEAELIVIEVPFHLELPAVLEQRLAHVIVGPEAVDPLIQRPGVVVLEHLPMAVIERTMTEEVVDLGEGQPAPRRQRAVDAAKKVIETGEVGGREARPYPVGVLPAILQVRGRPLEEACPRDSPGPGMVDEELVQIHTHHVRPALRQIAGLVTDAAPDIDQLLPRQVPQRGVDLGPAPPRVLVGVRADG